MIEPTLSERFTVETPENIRFGYDVADIGSRFLAILIDSLLQGVLFTVFFIAAIILQAQLTTIELPRPLEDLFAVSVILALFVIQFGYFLFFEIILNGQTPGKRLFRLRVVKDNARPLSPLDSAVRNIVRVIDFFPAFYGIGILIMFFNARAKRLGDFAAGTIVVKMRQDIQLASLLAAANTPLPPTPSTLYALERLDPQDIELAESLLNRRAQLVNADNLMLQAARQLAAKMDLVAGAVPTTSSSAAAFLRDTVNRYRARL